MRLKRFYGTEQGDHSCKQAYTEQEVPPKPALQNQGTPNNKNCFAGRVFFLLGRGGGASFIIRGKGLLRDLDKDPVIWDVKGKPKGKPPFGQGALKDTPKGQGRGSDFRLGLVAKGVQASHQQKIGTVDGSEIRFPHHYAEPWFLMISL